MKTFYSKFRDKIDMYDGTVVIDEEDYRAIQEDAREGLGALEGLRYALHLTQSRRGLLGRLPAYVAALDELQIFLEAAISRVEQGGQMAPTAVTQASA